MSHITLLAQMTSTISEDTVPVARNLQFQMLAYDLVYNVSRRISAIHKRVTYKIREVSYISFDSHVDSEILGP